MKEAQTSLDLDRLIDRLHLEPDEPGVFSLALVRDGERWRLRAGSLLFGPPKMGQVAWTDWMVEESGHGHFTDVHGIHRDHPATFAVDQGPWRLIRFVLPQVASLELLGRWIQTGVLEGGAGLDEDVHTSLGPPGAPGLVLSGSTGPASRLCGSASRPVTGWLHPGSDGTEVDLPYEWQVTPGAAPCNAPLLLLGLGAIAEEPRGLLVGRLARSAWIATMRGNPPHLRDFTVTIGLDAERQSLWDLVLDVEETDRDGHLLTARRLRLADLQLPAVGESRYDVAFPSSGKGLTRKVRLYGLDGALFDGHDAVHLLESITVNFRVEGRPETATTVQVGDAQQPSLTQRLDEIDRANLAYSEVLRAGLSNRIIVNRSGGTQALRQRLAASRGELRILDPYFGEPGTVWDALHDVAVPIRILTTARSFQAPPPGTAPRAPALHIRHVNRRRSIFHDRSYAWSGGGVSVGASVNGLDGKALYLMEVLDPIVVADLAGHFDTWWSAAAELWHRL